MKVLLGPALASGALAAPFTSTPVPTLQYPLSYLCLFWKRCYKLGLNEILRGLSGRTKCHANSPCILKADKIFEIFADSVMFEMCFDNYEKP